MRAVALVALVVAACTSPVAAPRSLAGGDVDAPAAPRDYDVRHVLSTGQSLALGLGGVPLLSTTQPFGNLTFKKGLIWGGQDPDDDFAPLVESSQETMSSGLANALSWWTLPKPLVTLVSVHGYNGAPYRDLAPGGRGFYEIGIASVRRGQALATARGLSYAVGAVTVVHGESDADEGSTHYADDLFAWQAAYERDVRAITGQPGPIPMLITQTSSHPSSDVVLAELDAHVRSSGRIVLVGPKYHLSYFDLVHLDSEGYRWMGEMYARVYQRVVIEHGVWEPLRPVDVRRDGREVRVSMLVPVPPLRIGKGPTGLSFTDGTAAPPSIAYVHVEPPDTLVVVLDRAPAGAGTLSYARTGPGSLVDSDVTPSPHGYDLANHAVAFELAVP